jgi:alanyl aminopeptidase
LLTVLQLAGCSGSTSARSDPGPAATEAKRKRDQAAATALKGDGFLRLVQPVEPRRYALALTLDPDKDRFSGAVEIELWVKAPTSLIQMHAEGLSLGRVSLVSAGGRREPALDRGAHGWLGLRFAEALPRGRATLSLEYGGTFAPDSSGAYRVKKGERFYIFTQLEATFARRVLPCFDQPEHKTPFRVELRVPRGMPALSNGVEVSRKQVGGLDAVTFSETQPLPTYALAFVVGPVEVVPVPSKGSSVPLRLVVPRGSSQLTGFVAARAPAILRQLEEYFGIPYPYGKLDLVAEPGKMGAMEHPGLVTFNESLLLLDENAPPSTKLDSLGTLAHELAHMWFGNLVTLRWWNDTWLNEAFATWITPRIVDAVEPALECTLEAVLRVLRVMHTDGLGSARAIRQPIRDAGDILNAFDDITYVKGGGVIRAMESWIGEQRFQGIVRRYLRAHAHRTSTTQDFFEELDRGAGRSASTVMATFLDQPGVPLLELAPRCPAGKVELGVRQSRYLPSGTSAKAGLTWKIPFCVRHPEGRNPARECFLLDREAGTFPLSASACPETLVPNDHEGGYYHVQLPPEHLQRLLGHLDQLGLEERVALPHHLFALLLASRLPASRYFEAVSALFKQKHRLILKGLLGDLLHMGRLGLTSKAQAELAALARRLLAPHLERVGLRSTAGEPVEKTFLRPMLVRAMAELSDDKRLYQRARAEMDRALSGEVPMDQATVEVWSDLAAMHGDEALWRRFKDALTRVTQPGLRDDLAAAMGCFRDPSLLGRSLDLTLDGTLPPSKLFRLAECARKNPGARGHFWSWLERNFDRVSKGLGEFAAFLPESASSFCTAEDREKAQRFFGGRARAFPGLQHHLDLALERIDLCIRLRGRVEGALAPGR